MHSMRLRFDFLKYEAIKKKKGAGVTLPCDALNWLNGGKTNLIPAEGAEYQKQNKSNAMRRNYYVCVLYEN
jgi:hypothetical protein